MAIKHEIFLKPSKKTLRKQLDTLWSLIIRLRDKRKYGPSCRRCLTRLGEVACHTVPKQRGDAIRWDIDNGYLGCSGCNWGEVNNRSLYRAYHVAMFGKEHVEALEAKAATKAQFSLRDLLDMRTEFRRILEGRA